MKKRKNEAEIDDLVAAQAADESVWSKPVTVKRNVLARISLSPELAAKAAFLARLHHKANAQEWLRSVIEERVDFEESACAGLKEALTRQMGRHARQA
jgi:hypothetical protein